MTTQYYTAFSRVGEGMVHVRFDVSRPTVVEVTP